MNGNEVPVPPSSWQGDWDEEGFTDWLAAQNEAAGQVHEVVIECPVVIEFVGARLTADAQAQLVRAVMQQLASLTNLG